MSLASVPFYDDVTKSNVHVPSVDVTKTQYGVRRGAVYAFRGHLPDGRTLTRFVTRQVWEGSAFREEA